MSVLFPQVNKPRKWDYRPIYYDPKKDEREQKLKKLRAQREANEAADNEAHEHNLHRGSFREAKDSNRSSYVDNARKGSRLAFWIALFLMLLLFVWALS